MLFRSIIPIRFSDVDHAQILYYPRFFHLFHQAFEDFFNDYLEVPYAQVLALEKVGFPAVHAEADYLHPLRFGDVAEIELRIDRIGNKSATFSYAVRSKAHDHAVEGLASPPGTLCARGQVVVVAIDLDTLGGIPIPDRYRAMFEAYRASCAAHGDG